MRAPSVVDFKQFDEGNQAGFEHRRRREADRLDAAGEYSRAASAVRSFDQGAASAYERAQAAGEERDERTRDRRYQSEVGDAVVRNDYAGAERVAASHGRAADIGALREMAAKADARTLALARRENESIAKRLFAIQQMPEAERPAAYTAWRGELEAAGKPVNTIPPGYTPNALRAFLTEAMSLEDVLKAEAERREDITPDQARTLGLRDGGFYQRRVQSGEVEQVQAPPAPVRPASAASAAAYDILTPEQVREAGLPPGSYQRNRANGHVTSVGRQKGQYTEFAGTSANYANRMAAARDTVQSLQNVDWGEVQRIYYGKGMLGGGSETTRKALQAMRAFINAINRRESGAAVSDGEWASARLLYFPAPGDPPQVVAQKAGETQRAILGMAMQSQGAASEWFPGYFGEGAPYALPRQENAAGGFTTEGADNEPVVVRSQAEFDALPSGTPFVDEEGTPGVKP